MNETNEMVSQPEENAPVYFIPKRVSFFSDFATILSWIVLVGFLAEVVFSIINLQSQMTTQSLAFSALLKEPSFIPYLFINMIVPLLTGLVFFGVLQAAAQGLNMLLEMDMNSREAKK